MVSKPDSNKARLKRHARVRAKISGTAERPRLNVFRSAKHIYVQVIDDVNGVTLVSASTVEKDFDQYGGNKDAARAIGKKVAEHWKKASARSCSTAADIFITAVSKNWPKEPVRAASNSKRRRVTFG